MFLLMITEKCFLRSEGILEFSFCPLRICLPALSSRPSGSSCSSVSLSVSVHVNVSRSQSVIINSDLLTSELVLNRTNREHCFVLKLKLKSQ